MKTLKLLSVLAVVTCALTLSAKADLMFLGFTAFENPNSPDANKQALADFLHVDVSTLNFDEATGNHENLNGADTTIDVTPGQFVVAHYGGPHGGSLEFFVVINGETSVVVPGNPDPTDDLASPESLSSARVFTGSGVPDSGTTAMLLGGTLAGVGLMRRYLKR